MASPSLPRLGAASVITAVMVVAGAWCLAEGSYGWAAVSALSTWTWVHTTRS